MSNKEITDNGEIGTSQTRELFGITAKIVFIITVGASIFHIYLIFAGLLESFQMRTIHLAFLLPIAFLLYPATKKSSKNKTSIVDFVLFALSLSALIYLGIIEYDRFLSRMAFVDQLTTLDKVVAVVLIACVLEATRRVVGYALMIISLIAIIYGLFGQYAPGIFEHTGFTFKRTIDQLVFTTGGIFGVPLGASATFIFLFVLFGEFLLRSGAGNFFIDLSYSIAGRGKGGPAKISVIASGLMGSISGSAPANVVATGVYTIPLMRQVGYSRPFAGGVEAAASTGGQIMPPVMGATAFIIAEFLGIPYIELIIAALIPAILYYIGVYTAVHLQAEKMNLKGLPEDKLPKTREVILKRGHLAIPLVVVIAVLMNGKTPYVAAGYAIFSLVIVSFIQSATRMSIKDILVALSYGAKSAILIAVTCACAGIIVGMANQTGIGARFSSLVIHLSGDNLYLALALVMLACIILGMGVPTSAAYIMVAAIAIPALVKLGVLPLAAHLFSFYFAVISTITPPVAIASYAAAGIAGSKPMETSVEAVKIGAAAIIVPYMFVFQIELLLIGDVGSIAISIISAVFGIIALAATLIGHLYTNLTLWERTFLVVLTAALTLSNGLVLSSISILLFILFALWKKQNKSIKNEKDTVLDL